MTLGVMKTRITTHRPPRIVTLALALVGEQSAQLDQFVINRRSRKGIAEQSWFTLSRKRLPNTALELDTNIVRVKRESIEVPGLSPLKLKSGFTLRGFQKNSDRLFLVSGPEGWFMELSVPATVKRKKNKKEERIHNDAAIFVTKETGHRIWSGGLPSLGKKR